MKKLLIIFLFLTLHCCCQATQWRSVVKTEEREEESDDISGSGDDGESVDSENTSDNKHTSEQIYKTDLNDRQYNKRSTDVFSATYDDDKGAQLTKIDSPDNMMQSNVAEKKSDVSETSSSSAKANKQLASNTQVELPVSSVKKLAESNSPNNNNTVNNNQAPDNSTTATQRSASPDDTNESTGQGTASKVESIGPMEGIEIKVNGSTNTFNNFTQVNNKVDELNSPKKLQVLQFTKDQEKTKASKKHTIKKEKKTKKQLKKRKGKKSSKKNKKSKKSKIFPKIILYQGPISKALESILKVHSTAFNQQSNINSPMSFEDATRDIKRDHIARVSSSKKHMKLRDEEDDENEGDTDDDDDDDVAEKKSKVVAVKQPKKYVVKGYHENGKADKKSLAKKTGGTKKAAVIVIKKPKVTDEKNSKYYKPSIVPNDDDPPSNVQFNDFIKQMAMPISTSDTPFFAPPEFEYHAKPKNTIKEQYKKHKSQSNSIIGNTPKPSGNVMEGNLAESGKNTNKETPDDGYEFEYPNPAGYGADKTQNEDNNVDDDDDPEVIINNGTNSTHPNYVQAPLQQHPKPANNPGTPKPVDNKQPELQQGALGSKPDTSQPDQEQGALGSKPPPYPSIGNKITPITDSVSDQLDNTEGVEFPDAATAQQGDMPNLNNPNLVGDLLERVQANSHEIDAIDNEVRDVESRLEEIGHTVNRMEQDIEKMTKKIDSVSTMNKPQMSSRPVGFPFIKPSVGNRIPLELLASGKLPLMPPPPPRLLGKFKRPRILKQFFVPLPPPNSPASEMIENGAPVPGLPFPLNQIVSFLLRKVRKYGGNGGEPQTFPMRFQSPKVVPNMWHPPSVLPDIALPPREHDLDRLELELGRVPINRVRKKPKIIFFSKAPLDLTEKPCDEPCHNGGECIGGNVCKCPPMFTGVKCERATHRSNMPGDIMDLIGPLPSYDEDMEQPRKSHTITLPLIFTETNNDDEMGSKQQKTMGEVDQSKLVDILSTFSRPSEDMKRKRSIIPHHQQQADFRRRRNAFYY